MMHKNKIGVCMDFDVAYLLQVKNDENVITIIEAESSDASNREAVPKKTKNQNFYRKIFDLIKDFEKVVLFGPSYVINQIISRIKANNLLRIEIENDSLNEQITENQKVTFINQYFQA